MYKTRIRLSETGGKKMSYYNLLMRKIEDLEGDMHQMIKDGDTLTALEKNQMGCYIEEINFWFSEIKTKEIKHEQKYV